MQSVAYLAKHFPEHTFDPMIKIQMVQPHKKAVDKY